MHAYAFCLCTRSYQVQKKLDTAIKVSGIRQKIAANKDWRLYQKLDPNKFLIWKYLENEAAADALHIQLMQLYHPAESDNSN